MVITFLSLTDFIFCILLNIYAPIYGGNVFNYVKKNTKFKYIISPFRGVAQPKWADSVHIPVPEFRVFSHINKDISNINWCIKIHQNAGN